MSIPAARGGIVSSGSQYTRPHSKNAEIGNRLFLEFDTKSGSKSIKLDCWKSISNQQGPK
jgi:hypothetical protein